LNKDYVAIIVPTVFFLTLLGAVGVTLYFRAMRERERHETLRRMVEKGMEIPSALLVPPHRPASDLRRGLVLVAVGLGLLVMLATVNDHDLRSIWGLGLIPTLMGLAYLATWRIRLKERQSEPPTV
jgi:hypothetical protein